MARATVERIVKHVDEDAPRRARLVDRIDRLRSRVSTPLAQMLDVVRDSGNNALHDTDASNEIAVLVLDDSEGPELLALLLQVANDLVEELITKPRVAQELWEKLPESVRTRSTSSDRT